jgi:hypothetical protein
MALSNMEKEDDIRKEMNELSQWLPPKQPSVPDPDYFETLPDKILQRWQEEEKHIRHRRIVWRRWVAVAAVSLGAFIGTWWLFHPSSAVTPSVALSNSEAYQYVMDNINEFEGLMDQQIQWPKEINITVPKSADAEEYLLEEMQGNELDQIF